MIILNVGLKIDALPDSFNTDSICQSRASLVRGYFAGLGYAVRVKLAQSATEQTAIVELHSVVQGVSIGDTITEDAAAEQLMRRLRRDFEPAVRRLVTVDLEQHQYDALVSFVYNVGEGNLAGSTLLRRLNAGNYHDVPAQLMRWTKSKGVELRGLVRRRRDEAEMWRGLVRAPADEPVPVRADPPANGTPASQSTTIGAATVTGVATTVGTVAQVVRETTENGVGIMQALGDLWPLAVAAVIVAGCVFWIIRERRRHAREDGV